MSALTPEAIQTIRDFEINDGGRTLGYFGTIDFVEQIIRDIDALTSTITNSALEGGGVSDVRLGACLEGIGILLALLALSEQCRRAAK